MSMIPAKETLKAALRRGQLSKTFMTIGYVRYAAWAKTNLNRKNKVSFVDMGSVACRDGLSYRTKAIFVNIRLLISRTSRFLA